MDATRAVEFTTRQSTASERLLAGKAAARSVLAVLAFCAAASAAVSVMAQPVPPPITPFRSTESYAYLAHADTLAPGARTALDPLKYVPLGRAVWGAGASYATLGGEVRLRPETVSDGALVPGADDTWLLQRYAAHADLHFGSRLRAFGQLYAALQNGAAQPSPIARDDFSIHEAFVEVAPVETERLRLALIAGRREHSLGTGRIIGLREGPNVRRSFDGVRFVIGFGPPVRRLTFNVFVQQLSETDPGAFDDGRVEGEATWGLYATRLVPPGPLGARPVTAEAYYIGYDTDAAFGPAGPRPTTRHTFGVRFTTAPGEPLTLDAEAALQVGEAGATERLEEGAVRAGLVALGVAYRIDALPLRPEPGVLLDLASGDTDPDDPDVQTFEPPYPNNVIFGLGGVVGGLKNMIHLKPRLVTKVPVLAGLRLEASAGFFWRASTDDVAYDLGKRPIAPLPAEAGGVPEGIPDDRYAGRQLLLNAALQLHRFVALTARYERFEPGTFIRAARPDAEAQDYGSVTFLFRF